MECPWCGSSIIINNAKAVYSPPYLEAEMNGEYLHMATHTVYSECKTCGLLFINPRFPDAWYEWFYSSGTYRQTLGISHERMDADEQARADELVKWLKSIRKFSKIKTHLDVGSSKGYFLLESSSAFNCEITAFDLSGQYACCSPTELKNIPFGLVSCIHVLEHVTDPIQELTTLSQMTSKYLLIEVPGINTLGGAFRFAHLYYFPPELLKNKIIELGFEIVAMETEPNTRILGVKKVV